MQRSYFIAINNMILKSYGEAGVPEQTTTALWRETRKLTAQHRTWRFPVKSPRSRQCDVFCKIINKSLIQNREIRVVSIYKYVFRRSLTKWNKQLIPLYVMEQTTPKTQKQMGLHKDFAIITELKVKVTINTEVKIWKLWNF